MPDSTLQIPAPANEPPDEVVLAFFRRLLPDFYFVNTPLSRMRRHFSIMERLPREPVILDFFRPSGAQATTLTLCAHDDAQPGLLSKVVGTLTALKINVHTAWIHTLSDPHAPQSGRRVILDTLILSESKFGRSRPLTPTTQDEVIAAFRPIFGAPDAEMPLLSRALRLTRAPLVIHDLSASPAAQGLTLLTLSTADATGVLFRATRALAALHLDVAHAQVNTSDNAVDDVFFVARADGTALTSEEYAPLIAQLRHLLQSEIAPTA